MNSTRTMVSAIGETSVAAIEAARPHAPYLDALASKRGDVLERLQTESPDAVLSDALDAIEVGDVGALTERLRRAKQALHLVCAAADLSLKWNLAEVTGALSKGADRMLQASLSAACAEENCTTDGIFIMALGKLGANELNYSSDVDVTIFYDGDIFHGERRSPGENAVRVARRIVALMEELTADGYAFRTDLRLRPDPRSTPLAVSTRMAENYYESLGQNWERMVYIKARPAAGDVASAERFLKALEPYVWRRHLDYWAIADIHALKRQINRVGNHAELGDPAADLKLGPGGIREIEFFAQTQQLILGGRQPDLRARGTVEGLKALVVAGVVEADLAATLIADYRDLRAIEHRVQMRRDEQTHTLPENSKSRTDVAALCGISELPAFDAAVREIRERVHSAYTELFETEDRAARKAQAGNLVFTGVEPDPGTQKTLREMGFKSPEKVFDGVSDWHRGKCMATRTVRGRELLTALVPSLLEEMAKTGEPDLAFERFSLFFARLPSGVQTLSMMLAEPGLLRDVVSTLALAPRLSRTLSERPALLEALLYEPGYDLPDFTVTEKMSFEEALDAARRMHREAEFRIGFAILHGNLDARTAGEMLADLADATVRAMALAAERETERRSGPLPGRYAICAMGKFGGRELSTGSDLDMIVIYDPFEGKTEAQVWFTRFTQTLITALSAATAEGQLYEVDMQLRPSGRAGPVAVRLSAFESYHQKNAWTWEHMALTRIRTVCETHNLSEDIGRVVADVLNGARDHERISADVLDMRERMARERAGQGLWDLKLDAGGLVDLEFVVQHAILVSGAQAGSLKRASTLEAIEVLNDVGMFSDEEAQTLSSALRLLLNLQQVLRLVTDGRFDPETASSGLKARIARTVGVDDFERAAEVLAHAKSEVAAIRCRKIGRLSTESA